MKYALYFTLLGVLWFSIWFLGVLYFETRRMRGPLSRGISVKRRALLLAGLVAMPCLYCLSYAPLRPSLGTLDDLYVPVQWVFDHTLLREPMLQWAELCDGPTRRLVAESNSRMRAGFWGTMPPLPYAAGWIAIGVIWCALPLYLFYRIRLWHRARKSRRLLEVPQTT
jgi:hypothetical protein